MDANYTEAFDVVPVEAVPGTIVLRLMRPWAGLDAGAEVSPLTFGRDNLRGYDYREVYVRTGTRRGETVRGEF